jgi:hypothetical protein
VREKFESLSKLSPVIILNQISRPVFSKLLFIHHAGNVSKIEEQYGQMPFDDWKEEASFKKDRLPVGTEQFWIVLLHKAFKVLATFALICLITPVSNAVVERIFSPVSFVTMKARNRMQLNLDAVVRVRAVVLLSSKCCKDFTASPEMLENLTLDKVYAICSNHTSGKDSNDLDPELFM